MMTNTRQNRSPVAMLAEAGNRKARWMMPPLDRLRLERGVKHLCALGPRAMTELLAEVAESAGCAPCILDHLARYQRLTPAIVRAAGGDRMPSHRPRRVPL